jgi:hypothetical protein
MYKQESLRRTGKPPDESPAAQCVQGSNPGADARQGAGVAAAVVAGAEALGGGGGEFVRAAIFLVARLLNIKNAPHVVATMTNQRVMRTGPFSCQGVFLVRLMEVPLGQVVSEDAFDLRTFGRLQGSCPLHFTRIPVKVKTN